MVTSPFSSVNIPEVTLHDVLLHVFKTNADKPSLIDGRTGKSLKYGELEAIIRRAASGLHRLGVRQGDIVVAFSPNSHEYIFLMFAVLCNGAAVSTLNPSYTPYELAHGLKNSGSPWVFTVKGLLGTVKEAAKQAGINIKGIIVADADDTLSAEIVPFHSVTSDDGLSFPKVSINPRKETAIIPYSSGTTGLPKGVMLTHYNIVAMMSQFGHADVSITSHGPNETPVLLSYLPYFHVYGMLGVLIIGLAVGATVVTLPRFSPNELLRCIEKFKVTVVPFVPPVVLSILHSANAKDYDLSSVKQINCGAAPLSRETELEFKQFINVGDIRQGFGMTETTICVLLMAGSKKLKTGSVGMPLPNTEVQIIDPETKKVLGPNERGEVCAKGPQIMKGYLNNEKATRETIDEDGWLHTGDIGYYDEEGYFFIVDRIKELIKYKGFQVAPAELEALILSHPDVDDVAVIGIPDVEAGEVPRAYVVIKRGRQLTVDQVKKHVADHVSTFKHLRGGVEFVDVIPKSETGKILRRALRDRASATASKL